MPTDFAEFYQIVCKLLPDPNHWNFPIIASSTDSALSFLKTDDENVEPPRPNIAVALKDSNREEELTDDSRLDGSKESPEVSNESDASNLDSSTQEEETEQKHCHNCKTTTTRMWRRDKEGECMCNACWLYSRHKGVDRPETLWNKEILTRRRGKKTKKK